MKAGSKVISVALIALFGGALFGCSSPCDDLKTQCSKCTDSASMAACNSVVSANNSDACKAAKTAYAPNCPQ